MSAMILACIAVLVVAVLVFYAIHRKVGLRVSARRGGNSRSASKWRPKADRTMAGCRAGWATTGAASASQTIRPGLTGGHGVISP